MIEARRSHNHIKLTRSDKVFFTTTYVLMVLLMVITAYPLLYILACSFSSRTAILSGKVVIIPVDFSIEGYQKVFEYNDVLTGYLNTFFYTIFGTLINIVVTMLCAYPMARNGWPLKKGFTFLFMFTMFFSGGMIPTYLLISNMGMINTRWALLLPGAMSVYNMIIARTFIQNSIPGELLEAAQIDGCSDGLYFVKVVLPLSKAVIAVLTLYYAVGHWNAYFNAFIYLSDRSLYPLQIILREILIENSISAESLMDEQMAAQKAGLSDLLQYSLIVVSTAPILCIYPFVQKYFIKGVMIGSVKG
ncbi:MAG: carbohydrate ABC transporter permease [Candidatus Fimadaptatus sp.]|jgi:putative aldouronate transport system permease protein